MYSAHIDEISVAREQPLHRSRTFLPHISPAQESALGKPFGFAEVAVPRTPQVDELLAGIEAELEHLYGSGTLRPGETPEVFFEHAAKRIADGIQVFVKEHRLRIGRGSITLLFGCVSGTQVFMTGCGEVNAFLIRRPETGAAKAMDIMRGLDDKEGDRLLSHLLTGAIGPHDCILFGNNTLLDTVPVADVVRTAETTEAAGVAASVRAQVMAARPTGSVVGLIARLTPVRLTHEAKENRSVRSMVSREEEVARVLAPSGIPGIGSLIGRMKKTVAPVTTKVTRSPFHPHTTSIPHARGSMLERFNALPRKTKLGFIVLFGAGALFLMSLQVNAWIHSANVADAAYAASVAEVRGLKDAAESSFIYDESRARTMITEARIKLNALPQKTKLQKATAASLDADLTAEERRLAHVLSVAPLPVTSLTQPGAVMVERGSTLFLSAGASLMRIDDRGELTNVATLADTPTWMVDDGTTLTIALRNGTLISVDPKTGTAAPLAYEGPQNPRDGGMWNNKLYVLTADGTQIWKLPTTLSGFGRGASWLTTPLPGSGASAIALDGTIFAAVPGDAIRQFEKGNELPFAGTGSDAVDHALRVAVTSKFIYALSASGTVAVWDKGGKLVMQYEIQGANGKPIAFVPDEKQKAIIFVTDNGMVGRFAMTHL
jgi:hypothetical protein